MNKWKPQPDQDAGDAGWTRQAAPDAQGNLRVHVDIVSISIEYGVFGFGGAHREATDASFHMPIAA